MPHILPSYFVPGSRCDTIMDVLVLFKAHTGKNIIGIFNPAGINTSYNYNGNKNCMNDIFAGLVHA
ncbi:hypothetical protein [Bacteroides intestinalis]|uniref:hypothetical protein n=1 Tax=Bacteroides intestinalis TaxID=329854 RepID=UPI0015F35B52|nr:hypothetical protein [Bacteroides intestinalis]